jgi:hypothetical protein
MSKNSQNEIWNTVDIPDISGFCEISNLGNFRYNINSNPENIDAYISTNGFSFHPTVFDDDVRIHLIRTDSLVAETFIPIPIEMIGLPLEINHIDGDLLNNNVQNLEWVIDKEVWRYVNKPPIIQNRYMVSSWGRFKHDDEDPIFGTYSMGYRTGWFRLIDGSRKCYPLHRIIADTFYGIPDGFVVNHIDGYGCNNNIHNLEVVTYAQNNQHARFTGLNKSILNPFMIYLIKTIMIKTNWSPVKTVRIMHEMGYVNITEAMVQNVKQYLSEHGVETAVLLKKKLHDDVWELISGLLIKHNGDHNKVHQELLSLGYADISIYNIHTVKSAMKDAHFPNMKLNRKITEDERKILIQILKDNDLSPSKAIKRISDLGMEHVTIYDLKYLKRKYLVNNGND